MLSTAVTRRSIPIVVLATEHVSPPICPDFVWPSQQEIVITQHDAAALLEGEGGAPAQWNDDTGYFLTTDDKIWLP